MTRNGKKLEKRVFFMFITNLDMRTSNLEGFKPRPFSSYIKGQGCGHGVQPGIWGMSPIYGP
jgi:hypothetical protein